MSETAEANKGGPSVRPVLQKELEFRARLDDFRPRLIQWAREVEKPLGEVGDLRSAFVHLRHLLNVANTASVFEELVLYVEYQGARRSLHIPVANRIKAHLREIEKAAGNDENLQLALARDYAGYVARIAKIAQVQRGGRPVGKVAKGPGGAPGGAPQGKKGDRPDRGERPGGGGGGQPGQPGEPGKGKRRGGRGGERGGRGERPDGRGPRPEGGVQPGAGDTPAAPAEAPAPAPAAEAPAVPEAPAAPTESKE